MSNSLARRFTVAALAASVLVPGAASAQSADDRGAAAQEKTPPRSKVHRLAKQLKKNAPGRTLVMADMPVKAMPALAPIFSWSGFYVGGNVGYGVASNHAQAAFVGIPVAPVLIETSAADTAVTPAGAIGGIQFGYNWQTSPNWLVSFETDFQGSRQKATSCILGCAAIPTVSTQTLTASQSLDYFGTVRARFGFVDRGNLFYVTGGGAYGQVNQTVGIVAATPGVATFSAATSTSESRFGWTVGAGIESSLGGNWTAKVEYLYMDLSNIGTTLAASGPVGGPGGPVAFTLNSTSSFHDNIVRAGVNYRFGPPAGRSSAHDAMAAVPPAVFSWSGFYVGANLGYGFGNDHNEVDEAAPAFVSGLVTTPPGSSVAPQGVLGGAQFGYNWQASPHWLAGFEADIQGTSMNETVCSSLVCYNLTESGIANGADSVTVQHQLDYFGTLRGRFGAVVNNTLIYVTGGGAYGHARETLDLDSTLGSPGLFFNQTTAKDLFGYAVGGGIEAMVWRGWSVKAEYLYLDLGNFSQSVNIGSGGVTASLISNSSLHENIVRIGANYHLGAVTY